jgi:GNAT superfamily N-acetyltransferase
MDVRLRRPRDGEAVLLSDLAGRSKTHWPYAEDYKALVRRAVHITEADATAWPVVVAEIAGEIVGFSSVAEVGGDRMLDHLWVEPEYIGRGLGRILFREALNDARSLGWNRLFIASDPYAEGFYLRMGARRVGNGNPS